MASPLLYVRDHITVREDLRNRIHRLCDGKPAGQTVVLAARTVTHDPPDYVLRIGPDPRGGSADLSGLRLIVVADNYEAAQGSISADGLPGLPGSTGAVGVSATVTSKPGPPGWHA